MNVVVTGSTGFLGSHIVAESEKQGHKVFRLKHSDVNNTNIFDDFSPDILVHCGWGGVSAVDRNDPELQKQNVLYSDRVLAIYPFKQVIALGSQDEYGFIDEIVNEDHALKPLSEYAKAKITFCEHLKNFANTHNVIWQWLRIFNMYGTGQSPNWLIPSVIKKCLAGEQEMQTTLGEQQYAYLFADDFARAIVSMFGKNNSGIYNISSSVPRPLRQIFNQIKKLTDSNISFEFGAIPYRQNQSMMICGDSSKFIDAFGDFETTEFTIGLQKIIDEWKKKCLSCR